MPKRKSITGIKRKRAQSSSAHQHQAADRSQELLSTPIPSIVRTSLSKGPGVLKDQYRVSKDRRTLKPRTKHVSRDTILSRWTVLDEGAQIKVQAVLRSVEMPILAQHNSEQKKIEAQKTIGSLTQTLSRRLPKMVFPPKTKEEYFDYEALIKSNRTLQQRLRNSLESSSSLREEAEEQKGALDLEQAELRNLEASL